MASVKRNIGKVTVAFNNTPRSKANYYLRLLLSSINSVSKRDQEKLILPFWATQRFIRLGSDMYYHSMNSCTEYLFMKLCKLHLNTKKTQILFGIIAGSFFSFVLSKSKYKLLTALYLTNTDKSWLSSVLLQPATWSNALKNAKHTYFLSALRTAEKSTVKASSFGLCLW